MRILIVEDDPGIVSGLADLLAREGYDVASAARQDAALELAAARPFDAALVDIALEQGNGFAVCAALKELRPEAPVIFLTASDDEFNTVTGLTMGADDYVAKPFRPRELIARIAAALRRSRPEASVIAAGPLAIDAARARVSKAGREVEFSAVEYRLLLLFAGNAGRVVTREMMREALWDDAGTYVEDNTLSVYVKRLRDKLEDDPAHPALISTVRGLGYRLEV